MSDSVIRSAGKMVLLLSVYSLASWAGVAFCRNEANVSLVWPASGVAVAGLYRWGRGYWPAIFLGSLILKSLSGYSPLITFTVAAANTLGPLLAAEILRRSGFHSRIDRRQDGLLYCLSATVGMLLPATGGAWSLCVAGQLPWDGFGKMWLTWWLGDTVGVLLVGPVIVTATRDWIRRLRRQGWEFAALSVVTLLVGRSVFLQPPGAAGDALSVAFVSALLVVWAALRFEATGAAWTAILLSGLAAFATATGQGPFQHPDLHRGLFLLWVFISTTALIGFVITPLQAESKRSEHALRESEERFAKAFDASPAILAISTYPDGCYINVNEHYTRMLGHTREEVLGRRAVDVGVWAFPEQRTAIIAALDRGEPVRGVECVLRAKDGRHYTMLASVERVELGGKPCLLFMNYDITHRVEAEQTRQQLEAQLRQAQKMEAIGTLAGGIAHDFNNILGAILGNAELARQDVAPGHPVMESLDEIFKAGRRAKNLVQQILAFSRRQPPQRRVIALGQVVEETVGLLRATLPAGAALSFSVAEDVPNVRADSDQINQVLLNLCTNAWQALEARPGRIDIHLDGVTVDDNSSRSPSDLKPGRYACLSVTDTGRGMEPAMLERIFEPFFTTKERGEGTGLGLSVVHGIVKSHDAAINVTSQPGEGAKFQIYFPAAVGEVETETVSLKRRPGGTGQHILLLDDEEALVQLGRRMFERLGYNVTTFTESVQAIAAFRANPQSFDAVITDYNMPGASGLNVAGELLAIRPGLPIALASGYITEELREQAARLGVRHLVYKPNTVEELCNSVHRLLGEGRQP